MTAPHAVSEPDNEGARTEAPSDVSGYGSLLAESDEKKVCDAVVQFLKDDARNRKRRRAEWACYKLWMQGVRGARIRRSREDYNAVEVFVPIGAYDVQPVMDRVDELLEKFVAHLHADPAVPDAQPATDSDEDRDGAEFTTRLLTVEGSESGYNHEGVTRRAQRKAGVYGSGFVYACIDPQGGGWRPMEVRALLEAETVEQAGMDPATGMPLRADDERLQRRFVGADNRLTDDSTQAQKQWLPKIVPEVLTGEQVVLLPTTCTGITDACGCIIIRWTPLDKLRATFADRLASADEDMVQKLVGWHPEDTKHAKPGFVQGTQQEKVKPNALVCTLSLYYTSHGAYPKGAYIVVGGGEYVLHKQPWSGMVETGPGRVEEECLMLPVAQFRQFNDDVNDDPYGFGLVKKLGPADEVRGEIVLAWQDHLDRVMHPFTFVPMGSNIQPDAMQERDDSVLYFNPQGKPEQEKIEAFPADAKEFFDRATEAQNQASLLGETSQAVESANVKSGVHAQYSIQQSNVNFASVRANDADGQERLWRVITQLIRVFYTVPMKLKYQGEDGRYKEKEWSRSDLRSTKDIKISRGSFTQQNPEQKQAMLDMRIQIVNPATGQPLLDLEEYERLSASNIRATTGYQDNPHRVRVRGQLSDWRDGNAQAFADVRPVDYEQDVARIRWQELRREVAGKKYLKMPPELQTVLVNEYNLMRQAAGVATLQEQQMAAQQQQQAATQADQQKAGDANASKERQQQAQLRAQSQESESQRAFDAEQQTQQNEMELTREAMRSQGAPVPA